MTEDELRSEYWVDNRHHPDFPLWVIFKQVGADPSRHGGLAYVRQSDCDVATVLKRLELLDDLPAWAQKIGVTTDELRACLWYVIWKVETATPPATWQEWNRRVDEAWANHVLTTGNPG